MPVGTSLRSNANHGATPSPYGLSDVSELRLIRRPAIRECDAMTRVPSIQRVSRPRQTRHAHKSPEQIQGSKTINATRAKNAFGEIMESVRKFVPVFIEKHGKAEAVVLNVSHYRTLVHQARTPDEVHLDGLREDFETLYLSMQHDKSRKAVDSLLSASAENLNKTAAERARRRG